MKKGIIVLIGIVCLACQKDSSVLTLQFELPKQIKEISGMVHMPQTKLIWALEDSGNKNVLLGLDANSGDIKKTCTIVNATNVDWEELTKDAQGNVYIGDFGNNRNTRRDLCIYKIGASQLDASFAKADYKISFSFPEQKEFPPKKTERLYDTEAFIEYQGYFYLFAKNRSKNFDGTSLVYKIRNAAGVQQAQLIGKIKTCDTYNSCQITGAALSPDESKVVLLCHDKVFLLAGFKGGTVLNGTKTLFELGHFSQKESIAFIDDNQILIADEAEKKGRSSMYLTSLRQLKTKP
ncbi:hypothetical protein [Flavobacterium sp.]|uniref:hypothetical protein n=1 Tax=Flavobacterium sp. TaxID=239 RepID=UPI0022C7D391|nr:hypothetical protein [Flavobacterium sp.]MCZ8228364.1 hypothetical protein [Flavobacterium sp.]